jgi:hypothetical protein
VIRFGKFVTNLGVGAGEMPATVQVKGGVKEGEKSDRGLGRRRSNVDPLMRPFWAV